MKTYFFALLLMPVICEAGNTLTMHVFDENDQVNSGLNTVALTNESAPNEMEMVIFANDEPNRMNSYGYAPPEEVPVSTQSQKDFTFNYEIDTGYQHDTLDWQVSTPTAKGGTSSSNVTKWQNDSASVGTSFDIGTPMGVVFKGGGSYAWTVDGTGQEIAYLGDGNKAKTTSNVKSNASNGYGWNLSLATGYEFKFGSDKNVSFAATPLAGYSWQERKNTLSGGQQQIKDAGANLSNKENVYLSSWKGPWVGLDLEMTILKKHQLFSEAEYHWADYKANANWQQVADLSHPNSFTHNGNATGWLTSAGYRYKLNKQLAVKIAADYQRWQIDGGREQMNLSDGTQVNSALTKLNRESLGVNVGINYSF